MINYSSVINRHFPALHEVNPLEAPLAEQAQRSNSVHQAPSLAQVERELNEWAKDAPPNEDRIATKEKILAAFQNPPELLELDKIGVGQMNEDGGWVPHLPRCLENLPCKAKCKFLNGSIQEGTWRHIPGMNNVGLIEGTVQFPDGETIKGTWQYIPEMKCLQLTEGTVQFSSGHTETGTRTYIPERKNVCLTEGTIQWPSGKTETGTHAYIPELKKLCLTKGTRQFTNGRIEQGTFKYVAQPQNTDYMRLVEGVVTLSDGTRKQYSKGSYSKLLRKMTYKETQLPNVERPTKPTPPLKPTPPKKWDVLAPNTPASQQAVPPQATPASAPV